MNGKSFSITGLNINRSSGTYIGLFGYTESSSEISNVILKDVKITGMQDVGSLVGQNKGTIIDSSATGTVVGDSNTGGLVGNNQSTIKTCYSEVTVTGVDGAGGLIGNNNGTLSSSYSTGSVQGDYTLGGLVGSNSNSINNCYTSGTVSGNDDWIGGLVGSNYNSGSINSCYASGTVSGSNSIGGLVGEDYGAVSSSYYDSQTTGQSDDNGKGSPRTTTQMKQGTNDSSINGDKMYNNWDIDLWNFVDNNSYPKLY